MNLTLTPLDILIVLAIVVLVVAGAEAYWNRKVTDRKPADEEFADRLRRDVEEGGLPLTTAQEVIKADVLAGGKHRAAR